MAITFRSFATSTEGSSPRVCSKPAGVAAGDWLFLHFGCLTTDAAPTVPDGFDLVASEVSSIPTTRIYRKIAGGSEPSSYSVSFASGSTRNVAISAFYPGAGKEIEVDASASQFNSSGNRIFPSVSTTVTNTLLCMFATLANTGSTPPGGATERYDTDSNRLYLMTEPIAGTGATGTRTATGVSAANATVTIALREVDAADLTAPKSFMHQQRLRNQ